MTLSAAPIAKTVFTSVLEAETESSEFMMSKRSHNVRSWNHLIVLDITTDSIVSNSSTKTSFSLEGGTHTSSFGTDDKDVP